VETQAGTGRLDARIGRKTCATLLLAGGVPPNAVAALLGDNLPTIISHYAGVIPVARPSAIGRI